MASATLAFTSSSLCATPSKLPYNQNSLSLSLSKPNTFTSLSTPLQRLNLSPLRTSQEPPFSSVVVKATDTETAVRESPAVVIENIKRLVAESKDEPRKEKPAWPKPEEIFAVVMIGSRQYIVFPGRWITTQRLKDANANDKIVLNKVLLVGTRDKTYIGKPVVTNAVVHAVVEEQLLDKKVIVFKYKKKKNYRRNIGHRQPITRIKITGITGYEDFPAATLEPESVSS